MIAHRITVGGADWSELNGLCGTVESRHRISKSYTVMLDDKRTVYLPARNLYLMVVANRLIAETGGDYDLWHSDGPTPAVGHFDGGQDATLKKKPPSPKYDGSLREGDAVEVRDGNEPWEPGTITARRKDGKFLVKKAGWFASFVWEDLRRVKVKKDATRSLEPGAHDDLFASEPSPGPGRLQRREQAIERRLAKSGSLKKHWRAADRGSCAALNRLGALYAQGGLLCERDLGRSVELFQRAADRGDARGLTNLGIAHAKGLGVRPLQGKAVRLFQLAAKQGYAPAQRLLAEMESTTRGDGDGSGGGGGPAGGAEAGLGAGPKVLGVGAQTAALFDQGKRLAMARQYQEAAVSIRAAAERGHGEAQYILGSLYATGRGVDQLDAEAKAWWLKAANQGFAEAQFNLGFFSLRGRGGEAQPEEARRWLRKAADQGLPEAQFQLGVLFEGGWGVEPNAAEAVAWFRKAAEKGHAEAQFVVAAVHARGEHGPRDPAESARWLARAAENGYADAMFNLGYAHLFGIGVEENEAEAKRWLRKAAAAGCAEAQFNMGIMYEGGWGVSANSAEARKWFRKAADVGHPHAQAVLRGEERVEYCPELEPEDDGIDNPEP